MVTPRIRQPRWKVCEQQLVSNCRAAGNASTHSKGSVLDSEAYHHVWLLARSARRESSLVQCAYPLFSYSAIRPQFTSLDCSSHSRGPHRRFRSLQDEIPVSLQIHFPRFSPLNSPLFSDISTLRFAILGMSLSSLLDIPAAHDFLRGLLSLLQEFDSVSDDNFDNRKNQRSLFKGTGLRLKKSGNSSSTGGALPEAGDSFLFTPNIVGCTLRFLPYVADSTLCD